MGTYLFLARIAFVFVFSRAFGVCHLDAHGSCGLYLSCDQLRAN